MTKWWKNKAVDIEKKIVREWQKEYEDKIKELEKIKDKLNY